MAKNFWENDKPAGDDNFWANDRPAAQLDLPAGVKPSTAGGGRGSAPASAYARPEPSTVEMGADTMSAEFGGPQVVPDEPRVSVLQDQPMQAPDAGRRLSLGAGPINQQTAARAERLVDGQDPGTGNRPVVERAARGMQSQVDAGQRTTFGGLVDRANDPTTQRLARDQTAEQFRSIGEWAKDSSTALASGAVSMVQMVPNIVAPDSALSASLAKVQQSLQDMESAPMQARRQQLAERVKNEEGFLNQYVATVSELVTNPSVAIQESLRQAAMFAGVVGAARLGGVVAGGAVGVAERASPTLALGEAISGGAMRAAAQAGGQTAGGVAAASTMAAGDAAGATYEKLMAADDAMWQKNPDFAEMVAKGVSPEQAKTEIATSKARLAALMAAPLGVLGFMGAEASFAGRAGAGAGRPLRTLATEMVTEPAEEALTTMAGNKAVQTVNPDQDIMEGAGEAAGMATVTSAPFGGAAAINEMRAARPPVDRTEQIKALRAAGDKTAADLLQRRQDREMSAYTTEREAEALQTFGPSVQKRYREIRLTGAKAGDAVTQTAMLDTFEQAAQAAGLSEKARDAALAKASTMAPDQAPGFLQKALQAFTAKGLAKPIEGVDALATTIETRRDELLDAVLAADIRPTMDAIEALENAAPVAPQAAPVAENAPSVPREAENFGENDILVAPETDAVHQAATSPLNDLPEPTPAQKEAGNYKLGRVRIGGMDISVENPQGSVRRGQAADGTTWETPMRDHYGYFRGTTAADGDKLDVFIKPGTAPDFAGTVFVVDQVDPATGKFDEAKVVFGATDQADAEAIYRRNYSADWQGLGAITPLPMPAFKAWATSPQTRKPLGVLPTRTNAEVAPPPATDRETPPAQATPAAGSDTTPQASGVPATGDAGAVEADGLTDAPGLASADEQRAASAEAEKKRREKRARLTSNAWGQNPFRAFLGKHGISSALANEFAPGATERRKAMVPGYGPIFRKAGKNLDMLAEAAREEGFIQGEDATELYDLIARVFRGEKVIPVFAEGVVEQEMESRQAALDEDARARFEDFLSTDADPFSPDDAELLEAVGYDAADAATQAEFRALIAAAEAEGIDTETLLEDAHYATREQSDDLYRQRATADLEAARSQRRETAGRPRAEPGREATEPGGREDGQPVPGPQSASRPEVTTTLRADGTLAVKGDAPTIRKLLADAGITNVLPMRGGVLVGKSSVKKAQALFDEPVLTAPTRADVEAQQDRATTADATDQREQVRRESEAGAGLFELAREDGRQDTTGGLFDQAEPPAPRTETPIKDLGEKIGGARKDTAESTGKKRSAKSKDERPAWARRFQISQIVDIAGTPDAGRWVIRDTRNLDWKKQARLVGTYDTQADAEAAVPIAAVALKHRVVPSGDKYEIWRDISDRKRVKVVAEQFDSRDAAMQYMALNAVAIVETNTTFGESDLPIPENKARVGVKRREGDVRGEDFMREFGFRGVEFGNWNNQDERQQLMNEAYDGLLDLAEVMAVPPRALGLNGDLALAFGARGQGLSGARAHYEPGKAVMNLTKMNGAGALAHEWFHALDHYFARQDGKSSSEWVVDKDGTRSLKVSDDFEREAASSGFKRNGSGVRPEVREAYTDLMQTMFRKAEQYVEDTERADRFVAATRADVQQSLDNLRRELAAQKDVQYYKRHNKPASAEQLAEFDGIAKMIVEGIALATEWRRPEKAAGKLGGARWTNDHLEKIGTIYKAVRGRSGFNAENSGVLDRLRSTMNLYAARLKMLADAQASTEKTKQVPTSFAMDAKSLDQGRGTSYWTTPHEMAARAFQGYVEDRIGERGGRSPFLNYGPENALIVTPWGFNRPFPAGEERKAINAKFQALVDTIQTRETETGVAMFARAGSPDTDAFKRWFGESKVVDAEGKPQVMYHGTQSSFNQFEGDNNGLIFVTPDPKFAEQFAKARKAGEGGNLMPVYVSAKRPFDHQNEADRKRLIDYLLTMHPSYTQGDGQQALMIDGRRTLYTERVLEATLSDDSSSTWIFLETPSIVDMVERAGFDSMYVMEDGVKNLAVFDSAQLKSATGNRGTFDPTDGDIRHSRVLDADLFRRMTAPMPRGMPVAEVEAAIAPVLERWKSGPAVKVVTTPADLPMAAPSDAQGVYFQGQVHLVASNIRNPLQAMRVLGHEAIAHYGLREMLGRDGFRQFTNQVQLALKTGNKALAEIRADVRAAYVDEDGNFNLTPGQESDEIAAKVVEQAIDADGNFRPGFGFVKAVYAKIAEFLRSLGLTVRFTHTELQGMLVNAQRSLEAGKRTAGARDALAPVLARQDAPRISSAIIGANLGAATSHPRYAAAKAGDLEAGMEVARALVTPDLVAQVRTALAGNKPVVVPVASIEASGRNKIPLAAAVLLADRLGLPTSGEIMQANRPKRTAMDGLDRIFAAPEFDGPVVAGQDYLILDDTLTQGATFASLAAHIEAGGGRVVAAVALTGKQYSAKIQPSPDTLKALRDKHGDLEADFRAATGYGFDALTESEARYLANFKPAQSVRDRIIAERDAARYGQGQGDAGGLTDGPAFARDATLKTPAAVEAEASIDRQNPPSQGQPDLFTPGFWETPQDTRTDKFIFEVQDGRIDLKRVQQAIAKVGGEIREQFDARLAETLYPGRVAHRAQQFLEDEAKPLLEVMARNNVPMAELSDYLHARGAEERNAQIAKVNPDLPDGGAGRNSKGVLLTNAAARAYLAAVTPARKMVLDALAKRVDAITSGTRRLLVDEGLEKAETIAAWEEAYKNYVPMFRDEAEEGRPHPTGSGMSVRGSASKRATGSTKEVTNILAHVLMQREAAITRAEKNRVAVALYGMALTNPNPDFWTTIRPGMSPEAIGRELQRMGVDPTVAEAGMQGVPTIRTVDPVLNRVVDRPNPIYKSLPGALVLKVNGEDRVLMLNERDPRGLRMAENLKNLDGLTRLDLANSAVGKTTRWLASVNTQYNPAFGLVNLTRDTLGGAINLSSTKLRGKTAKVLAMTPAAIWGIGRELSGLPSGEWGKAFREFQKDGGQTGYREMFKDANDRTARLQAELKSLEKAGKLTSQKVAGMLLGALDVFNTTLENAVRLAAYREALASGMSRAESARLGRELTVDFNRKGRAGREVGPLYAFFNAAVQGSSRTLETLAGPAGAKIIAGGVTLGVLQALMLLFAGYDDDEIPDFVKSRALIVPLGQDAEGKKQFFTIPYPLGLHVLPNTGRVLAELTLSGGEDAAAKSFEAVGEIAGAFNPLGGGNVFTGDGFLRTVAPSVVDPIIESLSNKNFAGAPIERESQGENDPRPGHQRVREATLRTATGQTYTDISRIINTLTGGNDYEKGLASPSPEMVRYWAQVVGGGLLREIEKTVNTSIDAAKGQPVKASGVPVLGRFYGEVDDANVQRSRYFDNLREIETLERKIRAADKAGDTVAAERMEADGVVVEASRAARRAKKDIRDLNNEAMETIGNGAALRAIDEERTAVMRDLNDEVDEIKRETRGPTLGDRLRRSAGVATP